MLRPLISSRKHNAAGTLSLALSTPGVTRSVLCRPISCITLKPPFPCATSADPQKNVESSDIAVSVNPSPYQGSFSYTCITDHNGSASTGEHIVIQFRHEKVDLWGNIQAHQLHGQIVPLVLFQGTHNGLYVYTSPLIPGIPYFRLLAANEEPLSLDHRLKTVGDLAKVLTHKAQLPTGCSFVYTSLSSIESSVGCFSFRSKDLKLWIKACILKIRQEEARLAKLPIVLVHMDMTPFNYLVDVASGQVTAILDWDGARYLPIGHNFHFVEHLFGYMTRDGWEDVEDREILESFFHERVHEHLISQGFNGSDLEALEHEKTLGTLNYYVPKLLEWKDGRAERYLERHLQHFFPWKDDQTLNNAQV